MAPQGWRASGTPPYWEPGDVVQWRYRRASWADGDAETVRPVRVIQDDVDGLAVWLAPGTPILRPVLADGRELRDVDADTMFASGRAQRRDVWRGEGIVKVAPTGAPWSVWLFWQPGHDFDGWYVNLEDPHVRRGSELVTQDHVLDVVVGPDRSVARKDEHELAAAVRQGRYSARDAARFEANAAEVEDLVRTWESPFCDGWEGWCPDPSWPVPEAGW